MMRDENKSHVIFGVLDENVEPKVYIHESVFKYLNHKDIDNLMKTCECIKDNAEYKIHVQKGDFNQQPRITQFLQIRVKKKQ